MAFGKCVSCFTLAFLIFCVCAVLFYVCDAVSTLFLCLRSIKGSDLAESHFSIASSSSLLFPLQMVSTWNLTCQSSEFIQVHFVVLILLFLELWTLSLLSLTKLPFIFMFSISISQFFCNKMQKTGFKLSSFAPSEQKMSLVPSEYFQSICVSLSYFLHRWALKSLRSAALDISRGSSQKNIQWIFLVTWRNHTVFLSEVLWNL